MKDEIRNHNILSELAFIIPMTVFALVAILTPMEYNWVLNTELASPSWLPYIWWDCGFFSLYLIYKSGTIQSNVIGTIGCVILGPITIAAFGIMWIFKKTGVWK